MNKACEGEGVREAWHEMAECEHCGTCVRWDLQDDPFFGFQNCREKGRSVDARFTPSAERQAIGSATDSSSSPQGPETP